MLPPALQPGDVRRFGKMRMHTRGLTLLDHKPPTGASLHRQIDRLAFETGQPASKRLPISRGDPAPLIHARRRVHHVERDLLSVQIQPTYDRHLGPPRAPSGTHRSVPHGTDRAPAPREAPPDVTFLLINAPDDQRPGPLIKAYASSNRLLILVVAFGALMRGARGRTGHGPDQTFAGRPASTILRCHKRMVYRERLCTATPHTQHPVGANGDVIAPA